MYFLYVIQHLYSALVTNKYALMHYVSYGDSIYDDGYKNIKGRLFLIIYHLMVFTNYTIQE